MPLSLAVTSVTLAPTIWDNSSETILEQCTMNWKKYLMTSFVRSNIDWPTMTYSSSRPWPERAPQKSQKSVIYYTIQRLDDVCRVSLPPVAVGLTLQILDLGVYHLKSTLTMQGLESDTDEHENNTRDACIDLAKTHMAVKDHKASDLAA